MRMLRFVGFRVDAGEFNKYVRARPTNAFRPVPAGGGEGRGRGKRHAGVDGSEVFDEWASDGALVSR